MSSRWWLCVVIAVVACRSDDRTTSRAAEPAKLSSAPSGTAPPDPWDTSSVKDPWDTSTAKPDPNDPPSLSARHARADKICPRVMKPYFYRVEKAGHTAYLLGSRHIGVGVSKFPPAVAAQFKAATLAVFETAPDDNSDADARQAIDLHAALGDADWRHLLELVGEQSASSLAHAPTTTAFIQIFALFEDPTSMLDIELEHTAQEAHIPTGGLETDAFQGDLLAQLLDLRALRAEIEQTKDRGELDHDSADDLAKYCAGTDDNPGQSEKDRAKMRAAGYSDKELDGIDDEMLYQRNARWIPKLEQIFTKGTPFVVVGCDHLKGPRGVVALLRAKGFKITRLDGGT
jgi:uncharacterized protein YbaP (TraB family)